MEKLRAGATRLGIGLSHAQLEQFRRYYEVLADWNTRINLTAITGREEVQTTLFLDSLTVSLAIPDDLLEGGSFADVGSGGGFPGIPLKIAFPGLRATLIDSTAKKTAYLSELCGALGLSGVDVRTGRAETLAHAPELREHFDVVLARALAGTASLAELTLPFCRIGGLVVAQKKLGIEEELTRAEGAISAMGGALRELRAVTVRELGETRGLAVLDKIGPTPARYPRRAGIPAKRPL